MFFFPHLWKVHVKLHSKVVLTDVERLNLQEFVQAQQWNSLLVLAFFKKLHLIREWKVKRTRSYDSHSVGLFPSRQKKSYTPV